MVLFVRYIPSECRNICSGAKDFKLIAEKILKVIQEPILSVEGLA